MSKLNIYNYLFFQKIRNSKLVKKATIIAIPLTFITMTSGCSKNYPLEDTILDRAVVANVDGDISVLRDVSGEYSHCNGFDLLIGHRHYMDVISGEIISTGTSEECLKACNEFEKIPVRNSTVDNMVSITKYLTKEEILKANNDELTSKDEVSIFKRIIEQYEKENLIEDEKIFK